MPQRPPSHMVQQFLLNNGFNNVANLAGGILALGYGNRSDNYALLILTERRQKERSNSHFFENRKDRQSSFFVFFRFPESCRQK